MDTSLRRRIGFAYLCKFSHRSCTECCVLRCGFLMNRQPKRNPVEWIGWTVSPSPVILGIRPLVIVSNGWAERDGMVKLLLTVGVFSCCNRSVLYSVSRGVSSFRSLEGNRFGSWRLEYNYRRNWSSFGMNWSLLGVNFNPGFLEFPNNAKNGIKLLIRKTIGSGDDYFFNFI